MTRQNSKTPYQRIYSVVCQIPHGKVATYGQIARLTGLRNARLVGYALHAIPEGSDIPWHRVINAKGKISVLPDPESGNIQKQLLEAEGIVFNEKHQIALERFGWDGE